ncbi:MULTISPECIES: hypothetical protein [unclassified Micromonospora]|uniref:hypothetical protein n=1 Tax=unclassified Micromonospora TaxID=2617518 RepID=UPI00333246B0
MDDRWRQHNNRTVRVTADPPPADNSNDRSRLDNRRDFAAGASRNRISRNQSRRHPRGQR